MKRLLIIDVENTMPDLLARILERSGVDVSRALDAHQAAGILMRENVDVVILDTDMPTSDGKILARVIDSFNPDCKIIVSSAYPADIQRQSVPGANSYHQKSEGTRALFDKVSAVMV